MDPVTDIATIWTALEASVYTRNGPTNLFIDTLQLRLQEHDGKRGRREAFVADTFKHGWNFDNDQAMAWAILELQADCAERVSTIGAQCTPSIKHYISFTCVRNRPTQRSPFVASEPNSKVR